MNLEQIKAVQITELLSGHVTPATAYVVEDYPYGYTLRCKIRYWLEYTPKRGVRLFSQTTNPKITSAEIWNKPKASTYARFGGAMYLDEKNHVQWSGLTEYGDGAEAAAWWAKFGAGVPEACAELSQRWVASKLAYDAARASGLDMRSAAAAASVAFAKWKPEAVEAQA